MEDSNNNNLLQENKILGRLSEYKDKNNLYRLRSMFDIPEYN